LVEPSGESAASSAPPGPEICLKTTGGGITLS
jgi:hypothetical protein